MGWSVPLKRSRDLLSSVLRRARQIPKDTLKHRVLLIALLLLGLGLRLRVAEFPGHQPDMRLWIKWSDAAAKAPLGQFYGTSNTNYPPGFGYVFWTLGKLRQWIPQFTMPGLRYRFMKLPGILGDLVVSCLLLVIVTRERHRWVGLWVLAAYLFNPAPISDSAYWGQFDGLTALWPLAGIIFLQRGKWWGMGIVTALALSTKFQTAVFVPFLFLFVLVDHGFWKTLGSLLIFVLTSGLIWTPYIIEGQLFTVLERAYVANLGLYHQLTANALNFWHIAETYMPNDDISLLHLGWGLHLRPVHLGLLMLAMAWIPAALIGATCRDWLGRCYALGFAGTAFFVLPTQIHERYLLPGVSFLAASCPLGMVATLSYAGTSYVHLLSCYGGLTGKLAVMMETILLPCFLVMFYRLSRDAAPAPREDFPHLNRLANAIVIASGRLAKRMWIPTVVLALCIIGAFLGMRGWFHRRFQEVSLTRIGAYRSKNYDYDRGLDGETLSVGGKLFPQGIQIMGNAAVRFAIPPGFSHLRFAAGIDDVSGASAAAKVTARFIVRFQGTEIFRSEPIPAGQLMEEAEVPLKHPHGELVLAGQPSPPRGDLRLDWINPRIVRTRPAGPESGKEVVYVSDTLRSPSLFFPLRQAGTYYLDRSYYSRPLRIGGKAYPKGIGTHADSRLEIRIPPGYSRFVTDLGYDDEIVPERVKGNPRMQFIIQVDGEERYRSPEVRPGQRIDNVEVPVEGAKVLVLIVDSLKDTTCDHADWGGARFMR